MKFRSMNYLGKAGLVLAVISVIIYHVRFSPVAVNSALVKSGSIAAEVMGTGTLEARVRAIVSSKISGRLSEVLADQGDRVSKGQLLARLDDADLIEQVQMAKADVEAAAAGVDRAEADINSAEASAVYARAFYNRMKPLVAEKAVSQNDLDNALQQRDVTEAQLRRAQLAKTELERQLAKAEATLKYYREKLADTEIVAPFDGLITSRDRDPGSVLVPGSSILQIISTEQMWVSAWVDESAMASMATDQPARVVFRSEPQRSYKGKVARISPLADRETREFTVDVLVDLPQTWAVGQRAEVYIQTASKDNALLVPSNTFTWQNGKPGLYVSNNGYAKWVDVEVGLRGREFIEIQSGLKVNDRVIWQHDVKKTIKPNRAVKIQ